MNNKCILLFMLMLSAVAFAQKPVLSTDFNFKIGEKYKHMKNVNTYYVASGDRFMAVKKGRNNFTIQRFSLKDLKEDVKKRQVIEDKGDFNSVMNYDGKAVVFYSIRDKAYAQVISMTGTAIGKPIHLINEKENIDDDFGFNSTYGFDAGGRINKFVYKKSFDGKKLLVLFKIKSPADQPDKIGITVFDAELNMLWRRKVTLPYPSNKMLNEDFAIDKDGNFYMTAAIFNKEMSEKDKLEATYRMEVFKITEEEGGAIVKSKLEVKGKSIGDAVLGQDAAGNVTVSGFYGDGANKAEVSGVFSAKLNERGEVNTISNGDIPAETLQQYALKRGERVNEGTQKVDDKKDLENIKVNDLIFNADGSVVVFGEQRYVTSQTTSSSSGSRTTYKLYYRNILAFKLSSSGKMDWMHLLPKYQMGTRGKSSMSYLNFKNKGKHYLLYVDDFTNLKRSLDEFPAKYYDRKKEFLYITAYIIDDATGEVTKEPILTGSDIRNSRLDHLLISKAGLNRKGDILLEAYDGKKSDLLLKISVVK